MPKSGLNTSTEALLVVGKIKVGSANILITGEEKYASLHVNRGRVENTKEREQDLHTTTSSFRISFCFILVRLR